MNRTISALVSLAGIILLLAAWCASGWLAAETLPDRPFLSGLLAAAVILVNAVLLYLANDRILAQAGLVTPVAYVVLVAANPAALWATPFHAAALLMAFSLVFFLSFCAIRPGMGSLVGCWAALGAASLLFPPLFWLAPVYAVLAVGKAEDKLKFWTASFLALCLPTGISLALTGLNGNGTVAAFLTDFWAQMRTLPHRPYHFPAATLCRIGLTALATLLAIIHALGRIDRYKIARSSAILRIIFLTVALCLLAALFCPDRQPAGLITSLPVALLLNEYFGSSDHRRTAGSRTLAIILVLVLLAERIACFV